jgi:hypothetical protein
MEYQEFKKRCGNNFTTGKSAIVKIQESLPLLKSRKGLSWILTIEGRNNVSEAKRLRRCRQNEASSVATKSTTLLAATSKISQFTS